MGGAPAVLKGFAGVHIYVGCACTDHLLERALTRWVQTQHARASSPTAHTPPPSHPTPTVAYTPPPSRTRPHRRVHAPTITYTPPPSHPTGSSPRGAPTRPCPSLGALDVTWAACRLAKVARDHWHVAWPWSSMPYRPLPSPMPHVSTTRDTPYGPPDASLMHVWLLGET